MVKRFGVIVAGLCLLLAAAVVGAVINPVAGYEYRTRTTDPWITSAETACRNEIALQNAATYPNHYQYLRFVSATTEVTCVSKVLNANGTTQFNEQAYPQLFRRSAQVCPANSTLTGGVCACNAGYNESGGQCLQNQCASQTGKLGVLSWTEGYTLTPDEGDRKAVGGYNAPPASGEICQAGCAVSAQTSGPGVEYYVSQQPTAQGLYRRSADFPTVGLGTPCSASDQAANSPTAAEPACPGTVGLVGNKVACVSTPSKPVPTTDAPAPSKPPIAGNPAAGAKPESGTGSGSGSAGRTPDAGTGGNAGGSASAAVGGKGGGAGGTAAGTGGTGNGTGTGGNTSGSVAKGPEGTEQAACGAPGQPVCDVKIREGEMPGLGNTFKSATDKVNENFTSTSNAITSIRDGEGKPTWSFSFQLPTGCTAYKPVGFDAFNVTLNPCEWQGTIHDLMSMIWAAATAFCLIGMVGRTLRST